MYLIRHHNIEKREEGDVKGLVILFWGSPLGLSGSRVEDLGESTACYNAMGLRDASQGVQ